MAAMIIFEHQFSTTTMVIVDNNNGWSLINQNKNLNSHLNLVWEKKIANTKQITSKQELFRTIFGQFITIKFTTNKQKINE